MKTTTRRAQELSASLTHHMNNCYEARRLSDGQMIASSGALKGCRMLAEFQQQTPFAGEYEIVRLVGGKVVETIDCADHIALAAATRALQAATDAFNADFENPATLDALKAARAAQHAIEVRLYGDVAGVPPIAR